MYVCVLSVVVKPICIPDVLTNHLSIRSVLWYLSESHEEEEHKSAGPQNETTSFDI